MMLPTTTLVTLATFLLELCSSSPVYNMQPAFITNTVGVTTGRNIRNLPCISRRNLNQNGVCMFAIDCLKANGTHLGTCIDRFYFGSCCHIEPVHEIFDNSIDTDIIPHREPPMRITNTTHRPNTTPSSVRNETISLISSTTIKDTSTTIEETLSSLKPSSPSPISTVGQRTTTTKPATVTERITSSSSSLTTIITPETSTIPQKLQTFQVVNGNTESSSTSTKVPSSSSALVTQKPPRGEVTTSHSVVSSKPAVTPSPKPSTTSVTRSTPRPRPSITGSSTTKVPATKPTKFTNKPTKYPVTTNKPASSTVKVSKKPTLPTKPTKRTKVTTKRPTGAPATTTVTDKPPTLTTIKPVTSTTSVPETTSEPRVTTVSTAPVSTSTYNSTASTIGEPTRKPNETITDRPTTVSNDIDSNKSNATELLETVNGNPATNEIEASRPVGPPVTSEPIDKPGIVTWTSMEGSVTPSPPQTGFEHNITDEWVPITTPDDWVLLPSVAPANVNNSYSNSTTLPPGAQATITTTGPLQESSTVVSNTSTELNSSTESSSVVLNTTTVIASTDDTMTEFSSSEVPSTDSPPTSTTMADAGDRPVNISDFTSVCGRRMFPEARIVGGEKSSFGKWPWQISLRQWRTSTYLHKCGAALLNENWAITAAHCVDNVPPSDLLLRLGEHDLSTESEPYLHQERRVQIVASHPQFDPRTFEYDLALLRFYEPVTFQPNILPVCVPQTDENFVGRTAWVTGWGRLYEDGPLPSVLQEVSVPVINNTVCESMYRAAGYIEHIPHIFICAGWRRGGFDSCEGDSGGPMVIQRDDNRFLLAGVISWGIGCAEPNQPGVYTRISEFREWINQILQF